MSHPNEIDTEEPMSSQDVSPKIKMADIKGMRGLLLVMGASLSVNIFMAVMLANKMSAGSQHSVTSTQTSTLGHEKVVKGSKGSYSGTRKSPKHHRHDLKDGYDHPCTCVDEINALNATIIKYLPYWQTLEECVIPTATAGDNKFLIRGCNLQLQNGHVSGVTNSTNGLGNLIVGYNAQDNVDAQTGSHNVIIGDLHTTQSYGGLIAGYDNLIGNGSAWSTISGGARNEIRISRYASISAGQNNEIHHSDMAAIVGGEFNEIGYGSRGVIVGGWDNEFPGTPLDNVVASSILGGNNNSVSCDYCTASGGVDNTVSGSSFTSFLGGNAQSFSDLNQGRTCDGGVDMTCGFGA